MRDSASFHRQASEWACCVSNLAYSTWAVFEEAMGVADKENLPEAASEAPPLLFEHHLGALPGAGISFRMPTTPRRATRVFPGVGVKPGFTPGPDLGHTWDLAANQEKPRHLPPGMYLGGCVFSVWVWSV